MSLAQNYRHNQFTLISAAIAITIFVPFLACQLSETEKTAIVTTAAETATAVITHQPIPWSDIGIVLGTIFGSGVFVDNRRKDILINRMKTENANLTKITGAILETKFPDPNPPALPANNNPNRATPINNN